MGTIGRGLPYERVLGGNEQFDFDPLKFVWLGSMNKESSMALSWHTSKVKTAQDLFQTDFSDADVVAVYLYPELNARLLPKFRKELRPGTRVVSHQFLIGDWPPVTNSAWTVASGVPELVSSNGLPTKLRPVSAYNPVNGLMYHWSGNSTNIFESINLSTLAITNIPQSGASHGEVFGAIWNSAAGNFYISDINSTLFRQTTAGAVTSIGTATEDYRGLALTGATSTPIGTPTLTEWGMFALTAILVLFGIRRIRTA